MFWGVFFSVFSTFSARKMTYFCDEDKMFMATFSCLVLICLKQGSVWVNYFIEEK